MRQNLLLLLAGLLSLVIAGCEPSSSQTDPSSSGAQQGSAKVVVLSIISDPDEMPQKVNMALVFAGFCLDEGYDVNLFLNVAGVKMATKEYSETVAFKNHDPLKVQLIALSKRGAQVHVCPVCMKDLEISNDAIIPDAFVTSKPKLFAKLGADTMVMTY